MMKTSKKRLAFAVLAGALLAAGPAQPELALMPAESIEGSWMMLNHNNKPYPAGYYWVISNDRIKIISHGQDFAVWPYRVDWSRSPLEMRMPERLAIFKVKGNRLVVCLANKTMPASFAPGGDQSLFDFRRQPVDRSAK